MRYEHYSFLNTVSSNYEPSVQPQTAVSVIREDGGMFFGVPSSVTGCKHSVTELGTPKNKTKHGRQLSRDDTAIRVKQFFSPTSLHQLPYQRRMVMMRIQSFPSDISQSIAARDSHYHQSSRCSQIWPDQLSTRWRWSWLISQQNLNDASIATPATNIKKRKGGWWSWRVEIKQMGKPLNVILWYR